MTTTGDKRFSLPYGSYPPVMTLLPQVGGDLSARQSGDFSITGTGAGGLGLPGVGTAAFVISIANAAGELISSGAGTASFTIDTLPLLLTASLAGVGSTTFTLATNSPLLGAEANVIGDTTFAITGALTPYATGNMVGSTEDTSTTVNANIVSVNGYAVTGNGQSGTEWGPA